MENMRNFLEVCPLTLRRSGLCVGVLNDSLPWSGTGCFIAVPICQQLGSKS